MTASAELEQGKTFQIITRPLNSSQYPAIRRMLDEVFGIYQQHINKRIYENITDRLLRLYNSCVGKIENMKVEFDQFYSDKQVTSSVTIYRQGEMKQHRHLNILSTYGPIHLFLPEGAPTANTGTIDMFINNISTDDVFHDDIEEIVTYFALEYSNYVPYYYTLAMPGLYEDRLVFVNYSTKHLISIVLSPLQIINRVCETGVAEIHGFISKTQH